MKKSTELVGNAVFAALFALITVGCLVGVLFCGAWWHTYTLFVCAGLSYTMLVAHDCGGQSVWKHLKKNINENFEE